jgi:hypothetical protein
MRQSIRRRRPRSSAPQQCRTIAVELGRPSPASHRLEHRDPFEGPDQAESVAYLYAWHRYVDGSADGELWGRYRHAFTRTEAGWRISRLVLQAAGTVDFHRATMYPIGRR